MAWWSPLNLGVYQLQK